MGEIKKIMVAVAFSEYSAEEFAFASGLATSLNAGLVVANIINQRDVSAINSIAAMGYELDSHAYIEGLTKERQEKLEVVNNLSNFYAQ